MASQTGPQPIDASPMLATTMPALRLMRLKSAAPVAMSAEPPTIALFGIEPKGVKKACIEPPRPRLKPALRAKISARVPKRMKSSARSSGRLVRHLLGDAQGLAAEEALHDRDELLLRKLARGREALGEDLAVAAVRAEDEVLRLEARALAHRRGLLADGQVGRALVVVLDAVPGALGS